MPPFPLKGLLGKELVNVPVDLLYSRNELLKKIIANAAKRKSQLHIDATGARMAVTPDAFNFGKNVFSQMHKKAIHPMLAPMLKTLQTGATKAMGGLKTYGKRLTGDSTLKPLQAKRNLIDTIRNNLSDTPISTFEGRSRNRTFDELQRAAGMPQRNSASYPWLSPVGVDQMRLILGGKATAGTGAGMRISKDIPGLGQMGAVSKAQVAAQQGIQNELDAIRKTRLYTGGAASGATLGGIGAAAANNIGEKQSDNLPTPTSRGSTKPVKMPEAPASKPDCGPAGVLMSDNAKKAFMTGATVGALGGLATSGKGKRHLGMGRGALIGGGTEMGMYPGAMLGMAGGVGIGGLISALTSKGNRVNPQHMAMGGLAGAGLGAAAGGYAGHVGTKALLDDGSQSKHKEKKNDKDESDDDEEVKEAAASMLAYLQNK